MHYHKQEEKGPFCIYGVTRVGEAAVIKDPWRKYLAQQGLQRAATYRFYPEHLQGEKLEVMRVDYPLHTVVGQNDMTGILPYIPHVVIFSRPM